MLLLIPMWFSAYYKHYDNVTQCDNFVANGRHINAGLCCEYFKLWDKCAYYLLFGARQAELSYTNEGDWSGRTIAMEYYGSPYTIGCLSNTNKPDLITKISEYCKWLEAYPVTKPYLLLAWTR